MRHPRWITTLLERDTVAYSGAQSRSDQEMVTILEVLGLVRVETRRSRRTIVVINREQFARWVEAQYPERPVGDTVLSSRARNIVQRGASKSGRATHDVQPILLRWFAAERDTLWARLTHEWGIAALTSDHLDHLELPPLWWLLTIENWESMYSLAYPDPTIPIIAVWLSGNPANVVLQALARMRPPPACLLHFGDYDWSGLEIFRRLRAVMPEAALYVPSDIESLFQQHRNRTLLDGQLSTAQPMIADPACQLVADLIARYNGGLEQEIVPAPPLEAFVNPVMPTLSWGNGIPD